MINLLRQSLPLRRTGILLALAALAPHAHAQAAPDPTPPPPASAPAAADSMPEPERFSVHGQLTSVTQLHPSFRSPYAGPNSLRASEPTMETVDLTLFLGIKLWNGGEFYLNPEIDQGFGLSNTLGVAGFPSGEAYKVGNWTPYARMPRAFLRQTFALGADVSSVEAGANALAGSRADNNLTLTVGKFSVVDIFDTNRYAHDSKADFLNWAVIDAGAFDYAANAWGYTVGAALEWTQGDWTLRGGYFALSATPNGAAIDTGFAQNSVVAEVERRFRLAGRPGAVRLLAFADRGKLARYDDAVALAAATGSVPDLDRVRRNGSKSGIAANLEQEIADGVGLFARLSGNDGRYEAYDFSEINRSAAAGLSIKGVRWTRPQDTLGIAAVVNGLSKQARSYFGAGGNGILIGDGQLPHYATERILEIYYAAHIGKALSIGVDLQQIWNPAYNQDRGPVRVYGLRMHAEF